MSRGEQGETSRGASLSIAAAFGVLCLIVLMGVVATTRACDPPSRPPPPHVTTAPEPYPGAFGAVTQLSARGCQSPTQDAASEQRTVTADLEARGYVAAAEWSASRPLPATVEIDGCGIVAGVTDGGLITSAMVGGEMRTPDCGDSRITVAACDTPVSLEGSGSVRARAFLMPGLVGAGLVGADAPLNDVSAEVLLAHAEAAATLARLGYVPTDELVATALGALPSGTQHTVRPPQTPEEGCVLWVGVSDSLGVAYVVWSGVPGSGYMPTTVSHGIAQGRATFGLFACGADGGAVLAAAEAMLTAPRSLSEATVHFRAYAPMDPASAAPPEPAMPDLASLRVVSATDATLPETTPFVRPEAD